jgi:tRNA 2-thiouridine synthesizing protein D
MKFSILITSAPYSTQAPHTAWRFAKAALENGHSIHRIFLHGDGVLCASQLHTSPQDEININQLWNDLAIQYPLDIVVCITSALKRGILSASEADRHNKAQFNLSVSMELSGLGQLIDAINASDRVITFGD